MIETYGSLRRALAALAIVAAACASPAPEPEPPSAGSALPRGTVAIDAEGGTVRVDVEIAETPEAKVRGLMGRRSLPADAGMVFLEPRPVDQGFWMKDTLIPLSIAFWGPDGRILRILDMQPCRVDDCPVYEPRVRWTGALEVNQGFFDRHGVVVGDRVRLERA
jgi:uncharacterized membrane protein (UPF0127 family)